MGDVHDRAAGDLRQRRFGQAPGHRHPHFGGRGDAVFEAVKAPREIIDPLPQLGNPLARAREHFDDEGRGENAVLAQDVPANGQPAAGFASQEGIMRDHCAGDMLEPDGDFDALLAEPPREPVEQVGGGQVAHHAAFLLADFVHVPIQQEQDVIDGDVFAALVHDGDAVGVAIGGQSQVVAIFDDVRRQQPQGVQVRRRRAPAKQRVMPFVDECHPAARFGEDGAQRELAHAVHRVHDHLEAGLADGVEVYQGLHRVHVLVGEIAGPDNAAFQRDVQINLDDLLEGEPVGLGLYLAGFVVQEQRAVAVEDFEAIPLGRVVAGGEHEAVGRIADRRGVGDERRGGVLAQQGHRNVVSGKDLGGGIPGLAGQEPAVVADQHAALFLAAPRNLIGQRLAEAADVVEREALADDRPPAAGAKGDLVLLLLAAGPEEAFLQDELGLLQVLRRVDALDFVRVVNLIALHPQTRANEFVDTVRQRIPAIRRRGEFFQRGKDGWRRYQVGAHVELVNIPHGGRGFGLLDDVYNGAGGIANDAPVRQRPGGDGGQQGQMRLAQGMAVEQPPNGRRAEQRGIAVQD